MDRLTAMADVDGIDALEIVRTAMIERRGQALDQMNASDAVLFTHAIWWLSMVRAIQEGEVRL